MSYQAYEHWKTTPLTSQPEISIVIPAYNEEERIVPTIGAIAAYMVELDTPWELIIADDGSTDSTVHLCEALGLVNMHVLVAEQNGGKGRAVQRGMLAAKGNYLLFSDADNSTPIQEISRLLEKIKNDGFDIAVGSRAAEGAEVENKSLSRQLFSNGLNTIVRNVFRIKVHDTQCGFKLYKRDVARRLHTAQTLMGFSFDLEILYLAYKLGYKVAEVPVQWFDAPGSKVDPIKEAQRFLRDLVKIKINDMQGDYANA